MDNIDKTLESFGNGTYKIFDEAEAGYAHKKLNLTGRDGYNGLIAHGTIKIKVDEDGNRWAYRTGRATSDKDRVPVAELLKRGFGFSRV